MFVPFLPQTSQPFQTFLLHTLVGTAITAGEGDVL